MMTFLKHSIFIAGVLSFSFMLIYPITDHNLKHKLELESRRSAFQDYCWGRGGIIVEQEKYDRLGIIKVCQAQNGPTVSFNSWSLEQN